VRAVVGLAAIDRLQHVAIFELEGIALGRLHDQHSFGDAKVRAERGRDAGELEAFEFARPETAEMMHERTAGEFAGHRRTHFRHADVEEAILAHARPRDDHIVVLLAIAQHGHLHLLVRFHVAHPGDEQAIGIRPLQSLPVERHDDVLVAQSRFGRRAPGAHADDAHAFLARVRLDLHAEHRAAWSTVDEPDLVARMRAEFPRQLGHLARRLVEPFAGFVELLARLRILGFDLGGVLVRRGPGRSLGERGRTQAQETQSQKRLHGRLLRNWRPRARRSAHGNRNPSARRACAPGAPPRRRAAPSSVHP
jgi:hypothetical protein